MVEARKDVTVVLHPLTDDRRILPLERTGEELAAPPGFMLVVSYNPGYQNLLKALKPSTRQRFVAIEFDFLPPEQETAVVAAESGLPPDRVRPLVGLAGRMRHLRRRRRSGRYDRAADGRRRRQGCADRGRKVRDRVRPRHA